MSNRSSDNLNGIWTRHEVPRTGVSAEFPAKPVSESDRDSSGSSTITLYLEQHDPEGAFRLDLAVSTGKPREYPSSDVLAAQLQAALSADEAFELLAVDPRPRGESPGALQQMRLRETGEVLRQWIICEEERTIFIGITVFNRTLDEVGTRFLNSLQVVEPSAK